MSVRAVELYSGIGGLHFALRQASAALDVEAEVVAAYDWDSNACQVYEANHGRGIARRRDISRITAKDLAAHHADLWLLSPSCQPYTVLNPNAKGADDPRAASFLHLVRTVLPQLRDEFPRDLPKWLLIENVAGFETSTTRTTTLEVLSSIGYRTEEYLLSPLQCGIPNSRLRYYLLATMAAIQSNSPPTPPILRHVPGHILLLDEDPSHSDANTVRSISEYLDPPSELSHEEQHAFAIPPNVLSKWGRLFDIVKPSERRTCCFTRGYTKMVEGTGSILQENEALDTTSTFNEYLKATQSESTSPNALAILDPLRLRYFTPDELVRIFHFPAPFVWPATTSIKTKYKLIGNSVNVEVVKRLIVYLISGTGVNVE